MNTIILFVENTTGEVVFITMSESHFKPTLVLKAIRGAYKGEGVLVDFWQTCKPEEVDKFFTSDYQLYKYDWESLDDETPISDDPAWDDASGIMWEIEPVQKWAKNETITASELEPHAEWLGYGVGFSVADYALDFNDEIPDLVEVNAEGLKTSQLTKTPKESSVDCPACSKKQERRFNVYKTKLDELAENCLSLEDAIVWSDGTWQGQGADEGEVIEMPNEHDDAVLVCGNCGGMFLLSDVVYREPDAQLQSHIYLHSLNSDLTAYEVADAANWLRAANLKESIAYLASSLANSTMIDWAQWTAAQQVITCASDEIREGNSLNENTVAEIRQLIAQFLDRLSQILEGTLGAMYPYRDWMSTDASRLDFELYESIEEPALANMERIVGDRRTYLARTGGTNRTYWVAARLKLINSLVDQNNQDISGSAELGNLENSPQ